MDPKTKTESLEWLKRKLGGGAVVLELCEEHFSDAFDDAVRWYIGHKGVIRLAAQNLVPGIQEYAMPEDCDEALEVWFPGVQIDIIAAINPYAFIDIDQLPIAYQSITGVPGGSFYGTFHQILAHAETARRIVGSEPAWEYFKDTNKLYIVPRNQRVGTAIARYISTTLTVEEPVPPRTVPLNDFKRLRYRHRELILRYAVAQTKERLGRVRGKYTEWPSAGGGKNMDGETLLGEAQNEIQALNEEIVNLAEGTPFLIG